MKEKDVLYFEEDDASQLGANGKQVFVAKRINGKTEHNKANKEKKGKQLKNKKEEELADNEIILGIENFYIPEEPKNKNNKQKSNLKQKNRKKTKKISSQESKTSKQQNKYQPKKKKKRKKKNKFIKVFILLVIIIGTVIFALVSPVFNIQTITVQGNNNISAETIISLSQLQTDKNIFQNIKSDIIKNIKEEPYIDSVNVKRILPGTIEITVEERTVAYQIQAIDSYVYIDYQGYILEKSSQKANVPVIVGMKTSQDELLNEKRLINDDISNLNVILKIVQNAKQTEIYDLITQISVENDEYVLYLKSENKYIYLGDGSDMTNKMMYAQIIVQNEKGKSGKAMINGDLDSGFKPYFSEGEI